MNIKHSGKTIWPIYKIIAGQLIIAYNIFDESSSDEEFMI